MTLVGAATDPFVSSEVEKRLRAHCGPFLDCARNERVKLK